MSGKTLYDKLWESHLVATREDGSNLIYIDLHLVHEVTTPQAFAGLREAGRPVRRADATLATVDHAVPTRHRGNIDQIEDEVSRIQVRTLDDNCHSYRIPYFAWDDDRQGIVHVVGPEQGATLPGMTIVCGDSHTSTHGALGALAMGVGTSAVEHVLATQCLPAYKQRNLRVQLQGAPAVPEWVLPKDWALAVIGRLGIGGGVGHAMEFAGDVVTAMSLEGRLTLCNLAVEAGSRSALIAVDDTTLDYVQGRPLAPKGADWEKAVVQWRTLKSDDDAHWDKEVIIDGASVGPQVTWGTSPDMVLAVGDRIPDPEAEASSQRREQMLQACAYMGVQPGQALESLPIDQIFIGACTNSRLEDLRAAAKIVRGRQKAKGIQRALVVPGSAKVRTAAESEGLHEIFMSAGFEWRQPGCSMCLGMNDDVLSAGERCVSTANRNFEGRAGPGGRIHLASPYTAAAAAIAGRVVHPGSL